jgi:hypothetical protein
VASGDANNSESQNGFPTNGKIFGGRNFGVVRILRAL